MDHGDSEDSALYDEGLEIFLCNVVRENVYCVYVVKLKPLFYSVQVETFSLGSLQQDPHLSLKDPCLIDTAFSSKQNLVYGESQSLPLSVQESCYCCCCLILMTSTENLETLIYDVELYAVVKLNVYVGFETFFLGLLIACVILWVVNVFEDLEIFYED